MKSLSNHTQHMRWYLWNDLLWMVVRDIFLGFLSIFSGCVERGESELGALGVESSHDKSFPQLLLLHQCLRCFVWRDDRPVLCLLVVLSPRVYHRVSKSFLHYSWSSPSCFTYPEDVNSAVVYLLCDLRQLAGLMHRMHGAYIPQANSNIEPFPLVTEPRLSRFRFPDEYGQHPSLVQLRGFRCSAATALVSGVNFCTI